ncbi:MAG TPA: hypothetical protein VFO58_18310 [Vicinamibacterales bacterium]|nr:hypothetical protein [Vicinamibacterales bacterium]
MRAKMLTVLVGLLLTAPPAWADFKLERTLALQPGGTFTLETDVGEVILVGDSASGARVNLTSGRDDFDEKYDLRFEEVAGGARVTVKRRGSWLSGWFDGGLWGNRTRFDVHVPMKTTVNVNTAGGGITVSKITGRVGVHTSGGGLQIEAVEGDVNGSTSGGGVRMRDIKGNAVTSTSGGGIEISNVQGTLRASTSGGGIRIDGVTGDLHASTSGGGVTINAAGGRVEAHSSGGPVTARFVAGNNKGGVLSTSGGGVRAEVDPKVALSIDASSSGGGVTADLPITIQGRISNDSLRGDLNGGGATLRLRSSGGGVRLSGLSSSSASR